METLYPEPDEYLPVLIVERKTDAGDILPTLVLPDDARKYIDQVDADYARFNLAVTTSTTVLASFQAQWTVQFASWKAFSVGARASVGFLDTKAVMDQTDRWAAQLVDFSKAFIAAGGTLVGPGPSSPGQGTGGTLPLSDVTKLVLAVGAVAGILILGPSLTKHFT